LGVPGGISDTQPLIDPEGHIYATASPTRGDAWTSDAIPQTVLVSFFPDGRERWRYVHTWDYTHPSFSGNWSQLSGPVISGDTVVIGHRYGVVRGVSRQDGSIRWTRDLSPGTHGITSTPVGDRQGFVYYHCKDIPTIHKIEASTGRTAWTHAFTNGSSGNTSSPTLSHDEKTLYIGRTISKVPNIYAINTDDGSLKWIWNAPAGDAHAFAWTVPVLGDDGTVFVQDEATATLFGLVDLGNGARLRHLLANPGTHAPRFGTILPSGYAGQFVHRESNKPVA
jgi:outer membrane protein assembly factor BamB